MTTLNQLLIAEATEYEFKSTVEANKPRSWLKTVSAFANGTGGSIYFGVSDNGVAIGLTDPQKAAEQVSELIKARIEPAIKNVVLEPEDTVPLFRSTEQSFVVVLKNLNSGKVSTPCGDEVGVDNGDDRGVDTAVRLILAAIAKEPKITQKNLAIKTGLSTRTISREIRELRDSGVIRRIGSDRAGHWEIAKYHDSPGRSL